MVFHFFQGKDVKKSTVKIPIVLNMELALMDNVIVRLDGKVPIVTLSTSKFTNVYHHALNTEYMIWSLQNVSAIDTGLDQIVRNVSCTSHPQQYISLQPCAYCNFIYHKLNNYLARIISLIRRWLLKLTYWNNRGNFIICQDWRS